MMKLYYDRIDMVVILLLYQLGGRQTVSLLLLD